MHRIAAVTLPAVLSLVAAARPAHACSPSGNSPHVLDETFADDAIAPSAVETGEPMISRDEGGCAMCGVGSRVMFQVEATDDRTPNERMGYAVRLRSGTLPPGMVLPVEPVTSYGMIDLSFDPQADGFAFELDVWAVDLNGNPGPSSVVRVFEPDESLGCAAGGSRRQGGFVLIGLALAIAVRRRNGARGAAMR